MRKRGKSKVPNCKYFLAPEKNNCSNFWTITSFFSASQESSKSKQSLFSRSISFFCSRTVFFKSATVMVPLVAVTTTGLIVEDTFEIDKTESDLLISSTLSGLLMALWSGEFLKSWLEVGLIAELKSIWFFPGRKSSVSISTTPSSYKMYLLIIADHLIIIDSKLKQQIRIIMKTRIYNRRRKNNYVKKQHTDLN